MVGHGASVTGTRSGADHREPFVFSGRKRAAQVEFFWRARNFPQPCREFSWREQFEVILHSGMILPPRVMLDIKFIRENKDIVAAGAEKKRIKIDIEKLITLDDKRRELQLSIDQKRAEQNIASDKIASAASDIERQALIVQMQTLKEVLKKEEEAMQAILKEWRDLMVQVPNVPDMSVPDGDSDAGNQEIRAWDEKPTFDFEIGRAHV